jgi:hypothetical protein
MRRLFYLDLIVGRDVDDVVAIAEEIKEDDAITVTVERPASRIRYSEPHGGFFLVDYCLITDVGVSLEHILRGKHVLAAVEALTDEQAARQVASMTWVKGLPKKADAPPKTLKVARLLPHRGRHPFSSTPPLDIWNNAICDMSMADIRRDLLRAFLKDNRLLDYVSAADAEEALAIAAAITKPGVKSAYDADKKCLSFTLESDDDERAEVAVLLGGEVLALDKKTGNYIVRDKYVVSSVLNWEGNWTTMHGSRIDACHSFTQVSFAPEPKPEPPPVPTQEADDDDDVADDRDTINVEGLREFMADVRAQLAALVAATSRPNPDPAPVFEGGDKVWVRLTPTTEYEGVISVTRRERHGVYVVNMKDTTEFVAHTRLRHRDK